MKMDILFWKNLSPDVVIAYTSKQYFKQYLYKLEVCAPGCKSIYANDIASDLDLRRLHGRGYNYGGSWWNRHLEKWLKDADVTHLARLQYVANLHPEVKIRTEEPKIQFYSENEQTLKDIVSQLDTKYHNTIHSFTGPETEEKCKLLSNNKVLVKRKPTFQFKVVLKEKKFSAESRMQIYNYLTSLGDLVKIPESMQQQLVRHSDWMWGCYFYTNDSGVVDFVRLMNPDIVREVSELVYVENK
jgi:hypothetical protein